MIVSINQPAYLPWLGYFHRIAVSDLHIVLDHAQFEKNSFINRNKICTHQGWCWLTVPVKTKGQFGQLPIHSLAIDNSLDWKKKHWKSIQQHYSKSPYFHLYRNFFASVYQKEWLLLTNLCSEINSFLLHQLGVDTPLRFSSQMNPSSVKNQLILELCQKSGADCYLSGPLGKNYLHEESFLNQNIEICYQNYQHPLYNQFQGIPFQPGMSILDLLFNYGPESMEILMQNNQNFKTCRARGKI